MKLICAPDSFKESLTAAQAARAMKRGVLQACPEACVELCPIADGGEGTVEAMVTATGGTYQHAQVIGPTGTPVQAAWGLLGDGQTAVAELAGASGLALVPAEQRDPTRTTTFGTGQLLHAALEAGATHIILGIGGSATNDGGCGAAQALGVRFLDRHGRIIDEPLSGAALHRIATIDLSGRDARLAHVKLTIACDVRNPLTGPDGAAHVYGPQKGATAEQVRELDANLAHLAEQIRNATGQDVNAVPGAGAAGGIGAGAMALLGGSLEPGAELVLNATGFDQRVAGCQLCLSGEGKLDGQSLQGKAVLSVAQRAGVHGVPTHALVGAVGADVQRVLDAGLAGYELIGAGLPADESIARAEALVEAAAARVVQSVLKATRGATGGY